MNKLPPHIENEIRKNPTAVLTSRGLVKPNAGGIDEVLIGIPNAAELYGEHFNLIREQDVNRETIKPNGENNESGTENSETPTGESLPVHETAADGVTAATQSEETAESTDPVDTVEQPEGQPTESQSEPTADPTAQGETKEAESPAAGESAEELKKEPESVELTPEEKEAARRKALSEAAKARHAAKKAAEAEAKKAAE